MLLSLTVYPFHFPSQGEAPYHEEHVGVKELTTAYFKIF